MTPSFRSAILAAAVAFFAAAVTTVAADDAVPTCASFGETWYFPNACPAACVDLGSAFDTKRSRNVAGSHKCFCEGLDKPFCTDDPRCEDLGILPGTVGADCERVCGGDGDAESETSVDFNGYQFHYLVSCSCSDGTTMCDNDSVLLSDTDYMTSCSSSGGGGGLAIEGSDACDAYCDATGVFAEGGSYSKSSENKKHHKCACKSSSIVTDLVNITEAVICDDATALVNDGSGLGNPCYENVGVNQIDCDYPDATSAAGSSEQPSATKTLVSSAAIFTGVWLLPL